MGLRFCPMDLGELLWELGGYGEGQAGRLWGVLGPWNLGGLGGLGAVTGVGTQNHVSIPLVLI